MRICRPNHLDTLVQPLNEAHAKSGASSLSPQAFVIERWLYTKEIAPAQAVQIAQVMEDTSAQLPYWMRNHEQERGLRHLLYKALLNIGVSKVMAWADAILKPLWRAAE